MDFIEIEYMVGGCQHHFFLFCQYNRLEYVDGLREIGHSYTITMIVEYVKGRSGNQRIPQAILLVQEPWVSAWFNVSPDSPFIHNKRNCFPGVVFVHDG